MTAIKPILSVVALLLATIGLAVCLAAACGAWFFGSRVDRAIETTLIKVDAAVGSTTEKVVQVQQRVKDSKITAEEVEQRLRDWTKLEVRQQIAERVDAEEKVTRIAEALDQADGVLVSAVSSVELVRQAMEIANAAGASIDTQVVDRLLTEAQSLRTQLADASKLINNRQDAIADGGAEGALKERVDQIVQLALRVIATLGTIDSRLQNFEGRLSETRDQLQGLQVRTHRWVLAATIGIALMLVWLAAGQFALFCIALRCLRQRQPV